MSFKEKFSKWAIGTGLVAALAMPFALSCDSKKGLEGKVHYTSTTLPTTQATQPANHGQENYPLYATGGAIGYTNCKGEERVIYGKKHLNPIELSSGLIESVCVYKDKVAFTNAYGNVGLLDIEYVNGEPKVKRIRKIFEGRGPGAREVLAQNDTHALVRCVRDGAGEYYLVPKIESVTGATNIYTPENAPKVSEEEAEKMISQYQVLEKVREQQAKDLKKLTSQPSK